MGLQQRKTLLEIFSTFLQVREDRNNFSAGWLIDTRLQNSMESRIQEDPKANEDCWALFWLKQVLENPQNSLARGHLSSYLEEVCYWITVKHIKSALQKYNIALVDGFLTVRAIAAQPEILKQYQPGYSKLKTYGRECIYREALAEIYQGREEERHSKAGLLRRTTRTRFIKILKRAGIQDPNFSEWLLALDCFQEIYTLKKPKGCKTLPFPNDEKIAEIAEYYNQRRPSNLNAISGQDLKNMLEDCQQKIRDYSSIKLVYVDQDFEFREVPADISSVSDLLETSYFKTEKQQEVNSVLLKAFDQLKSEDRKILQLLIGLNMTQSEIGKILKITQPQVCRKMRSLKQKSPLLIALAKWVKKELKIELSSDKLHGMSPQLEEWLEQHCTNYWDECLKNTLIQSFPSDIQILTQLYGKNSTQKFVAEELKISEVELKEKVDKIKEHLQNQLMVNVEKRLKVSLKPCPTARKKIAAFVETWLENAPYATFV